MAQTVPAVLEPPVDCRWLRSWSQLGVADDVRPPHTCACVREGAPRAIAHDACRTCAHWEPLTADARAGLEAATFVQVPAMPRLERDTLLRGITRGVIVLTALVLVALGLTILTTPLAIPVTVTFWLGAAALGTYGLIAPLASRSSSRG